MVPVELTDAGLSQFVKMRSICKVNFNKREFVCKKELLEMICFIGNKNVLKCQ